MRSVAEVLTRTRFRRRADFQVCVFETAAPVPREFTNYHPIMEPTYFCPLLHLCCGTEWKAAHFAICATGKLVVSNNRFHARQAALALFKMAKTTSDPKVAAGLVEAAADLKDQAGELPPPVPERRGSADTRQEGT